MPVQWVEMLQVEVAPSPDGVIYSTAPRVGEASNGNRYFLKGPDPSLVASEAVGSALAEAVGLSVPDWALTRINGSVYFASAAAPIYSGVDALLRTRGASDSTFWPTCLAFDMWLGNPDRNPGNLVAKPGKNRQIDFLAIDFEKSRVLAGQSVFTLVTVPSSSFKPTGSLLRIAIPRGSVAEAAARIAAMSENVLQQVFQDLNAEPELKGILPENLAWNLKKRAEQLVELCREVYDV